MLDPFPVGGGRTSLETFAVGTPIVMLYNRTSILQVRSCRTPSTTSAVSSTTISPSMISLMFEACYNVTLSAFMRSSHILQQKRRVEVTARSFGALVLQRLPPLFATTRSAFRAPVSAFSRPDSRHAAVDLRHVRYHGPGRYHRQRFRLRCSCGE